MQARRVIGIFALLLVALPARAQWYDTTKVPGGVGDILQPFTLKGLNLSSGGEFSTWIAPGSDPEVTAVSMLVRGGFTFPSTPVYLGLEVPLALVSAKDAEGNSFSQFAIGNVGLGIKYRLDPDKKELEFYTGWSLDVYLPTAWLSNDLSTSIKQSLAHAYGLTNALFAGMHFPESLAVVGSFDIMVPGKTVYFQAELSPAVIIPVSDTSNRDTTGAFIWGAVAGLNIIPQLAVLLEFKGFTPLNDENYNKTFMALTPGLRMRFGPFQPGLWVSIPLNPDYRDASPDAIIGADLSFWF